MPARESAKSAATPHKPLWRRLNRHVVFVLHLLLYLVGGTWIWTLNAPTLDKQFDVLFWLTLVCLHGVFAYRNRRVAFGLHLLMFCAGNGAIWATTAEVAQKLTVMLAWMFVAGVVGLWLARRQLSTRAIPVPPPQRKPRTRKPAQPKPAPEPEWYEPPDDTSYKEDTQEYVAVDEDSETPPRRKGRRRGEE